MNAIVLFVSVFLLTVSAWINCSDSRADFPSDYSKAVGEIEKSQKVAIAIKNGIKEIHEPMNYDSPRFLGIQKASGYSAFGSERRMYEVVIGGYEQGRYCLRLSLDRVEFDDLRIEGGFERCPY